MADLLDQDADQTSIETMSGYRDLIKRHDAKLQREFLEMVENDNLLEGNIPLSYMAPAMQAEFGDRIPQLVINIPRFAVNAVERRLDIDGIRTDPSLDADDKEQATWTELDMAAVTQQVHFETMGIKRAFGMVGTDEDGRPVVTAESPFQVTVFQSNQTRAVTSSVKRWKQDDGKTKMRTLLLPDRTLTLVRGQRDWLLFPDEPEDLHRLGRVPMVPFENNPRILTNGSAEFVDVVKIFQALNKIATDMMVGAEFHALPRRWATGVSADDFVDEDGKPITSWEQIIGKVWAAGGDKDNPINLGQFSASDLSNFHNTIKLLLQTATMLLGLPPHYAALGGDNPVSADAIRSSETQLVKNAERKQTGFGSSWKKVWQLVMAIRDEDFTPASKRLELIWRDPSTPTVGQAADAMVKLTQGDNPVYSVEYARERLGVPAGARDRIAKDLLAQAERGTLAIRDALNPVA